MNALKTGFEKSKRAYIAIMMADLYDNPKDIDKTDVSAYIQQNYFPISEKSEYIFWKRKSL